MWIQCELWDTSTQNGNSNPWVCIDLFSAPAHKMPSTDCVPRSGGEATQSVLAVHQSCFSGAPLWGWGRPISALYSQALIFLEPVLWMSPWISSSRSSHWPLVAGTRLNSASSGKKLISFSLILLKPLFGASWDEVFYCRTPESFWSLLPHEFFPVPSLTREGCRWPSTCVRAERAPGMWTPEHEQMVTAPEQGPGQVLRSWMRSPTCCIQSTAGRREDFLSYGSVSGFLPPRSPGMIFVITWETNWYSWGYVQRSWQYCT